MVNKKVGDATHGNFYIYFLKKEGEKHFIVGLFTRISFPSMNIVLSDQKMTKYHAHCADLMIRKNTTWKEGFYFEPPSESFVNAE